MYVYIYIYPVRCAHNPPPCRIFISWNSGFFFFQDFLDFGLPGSHDFEWFWRPRGSFFDDFWVFWVPGNPSWRLGGTFWAQGSDFSDFGDLTPLKKESLFGSFFDTFCIQFLVFFWVPVFLDFWWFGVPKASKMGAIWRSFWGHFWWPAISWFLLPLLYETLIFEVWRAPKLHHFGWLFRGCSQGGV